MHCISVTFIELAICTKASSDSWQMSIHRAHLCNVMDLTMSLSVIVLVHQAIHLTFIAIEWVGHESGVVVHSDSHVYTRWVVANMLEHCNFLQSEVELLHPLDFEQCAICEHILLQHPLIIQELTSIGAQPESVVPTISLPWSWICD